MHQRMNALPDPIDRVVVWLIEHPTETPVPLDARRAPRFVPELDPVVLDRILPPAPPCFEARDRWIAYVTAASKDGALIRSPGGDMKLNPGWSWCGDCLPEFRAPMVRANRCRPPVMMLTAQSV